MYVQIVHIHRPLPFGYSIEILHKTGLCEPNIAYCGPTNICIFSLLETDRITQNFKMQGQMSKKSNQL